MEVNKPEVVAEVRELFERYEQALIDKDVDVLNIMHTNVEVTVHPLALHVDLALTWLCCS